MIRHFSESYELRKLNSNLSYCSKCGKPWNHCHSKSIMVTERIGTFAVCIDCWDNSTLEELKGYYRLVYYEQESQSPCGHEYSLESLLEAVEREFKFTKRMKLEIEGKTFWAKYNKNNELIIKLNNSQEDLIYFNDWIKKVNSDIPKKDYIRDIKFSFNFKEGMFMSCFPILNKNETKVKISYDLMKVEKDNPNFINIIQ